MTETFKISLYRGLFALFTIFVLIVTSYFSVAGLGYAMDQSADLQSRGEGLLFLLPGVAMLLFLGGLLPQVRKRPLFCLGVVASLVLLAPAIACARRGFPAAIGSLVAVAYAGAWWFLIRSKLAATARAEIQT